MDKSIFAFADAGDGAIPTIVDSAVSCRLAGLTA